MGMAVYRAVFLLEAYHSSVSLLLSALFVHQENMSVKFMPPINPILYSKTGVCRGIPIFLIFAPKHR